MNSFYSGNTKIMKKMRTQVPKKFQPIFWEILGDIMVTIREKRIKEKYSKLDDEGKIADAVKVEQKIKRIKMIVKTLLSVIEDIEKEL